MTSRARTPSASWFRARFNPGGPKPVRNHDHLRGFPWLEGRARAEADGGNMFIDLSIQACCALHAHLATFTFHHPEDFGRTTNGHMPAPVWSLPKIRALSQATSAATAAFYQCDPEFIGQCAVDFPKPTCLLSTAAALIDAAFIGWPSFDDERVHRGPLPASCGHRHTTSIICGTRRTADYPIDVCRFLSKIMLSGPGHRPSGRKSPPALPKPLPVLDATRSVRGAAGRAIGEDDYIDRARDPEGTPKEAVDIDDRNDCTSAVSCRTSPLGFARGPVPLPQKHSDDITSIVARLTPDTHFGFQEGGKAIKLGLIRGSGDELIVYDGTDMDPNLAAALNSLVRKAVERLGCRFLWSTLQLNLGTSADWHSGDGAGAIRAFGFGHYEGGQLEVRGRPQFDLQCRAVLFDGGLQHRSLPFEGRRCLVLATLSPGMATVPPHLVDRLAMLGFPRAGDRGDDTSSGNEDGHKRVRPASPGVVPLALAAGLRAVAR
ncbi:unnamed protein product [Prorocentrum cordatum]|uniref:Uncharacterized protein n=1 Tax=Prorocentrum cordatum TaxID=2364126 RepID=A0ABN9PQG5_9DINO|nr:unnamed protein product [Polarella glacialis]